MEAPDNKIKSTHYTAFNFLPIVFFLQFKNVVVCFYTLNTAFQFIPAISTNSPMASLVPTLFIILVGMGKEFYLEVKRWNEDKRINRLPCRIVDDLKDGTLSASESQVQNIRVGDILLLKDDDYVPADCCMLQASNRGTGQAFIMTDALDGERNFKPKITHRRLQGELTELLSMNKLRF